MEWFKWWKDKTFMSVLIIALIAMASSFLCARFLPDLWKIPAVVMICLPSGISIRRIIIKRIEEQ